MPATTHPRPTRRRLITGLASAAALTLLPGCASAHRRRIATLELFDRDSGRVLPLHAGGGRLYAAGRPGARYALRLRNLSAGRVLVVLSVDGINVISGETAAWHQVGYVLDPGRSHDINGWRKTDSQVAAFEFAPVERSYAALTGRPDNVGVIGMAAFGEAAPAPTSPAVAESADKRADTVRPAAEAEAGSRLGTGHGRREWSVTRHTRFERASQTPDQVVQIEYDSAERLIAAGIIAAPQSPPGALPFPGSTAGYVADPPWR